MNNCWLSITIQRYDRREEAKWDVTGWDVIRENIMKYR